MSVDTAPKLTRVVNVGFATEATTGTAATIAGAQGTTNVFNPKMTFNTEEVERQSQGALSPILQAYGARAATWTGEIELVGSGVSGTSPSWLPLMLACGWQLNAGVLSPLTNAISTCTIAQWINGRRKMMVGCAGNCSMVFRRGQKVKVSFNMMGVQAPTADVTQILPTYVTTPIAPRCGASFTFGGVAARVSEIKFDMGNTVTLREDVGAVDSNSEPTGYRCALITNRKPTFSFDPEALPIATQDIYSIQRNGTLSALALTIGASAFNSFALSAPKLQIVKSPQDGDRGELYIDQIECLATRNAAAGDDEVTFTLS